MSKLSQSADATAQHDTTHITAISIVSMFAMEGFAMLGTPLQWSML